MKETKIEYLSLEKIRPSATNPRKHFDENYIGELSDSIRAKGILQPLQVRPDWCIGKSDEEIVRLRGMVAMLDYIYADGPHPVSVYRRLSAIIKAIRPKLTLNMSCAQLAVLCDDGKGREGSDGRATVSARIKRLYDEPIQKKGMRGFKAPFQKTEDAGHSYSEAARGNQNRLGHDFLEYSHATKNGGSPDHPKRKAA